MEKSSSREANSSAPIQEIPRRILNRKIRYRVPKTSPLGPIQSQINAVHTLMSHFHFNIAFLSISRSTE